MTRTKTFFSYIWKKTKNKDIQAVVKNQFENGDYESHTYFLVDIFIVVARFSGLSRSQSALELFFWASDRNFV